MHKYRSDYEEDIYANLPGKLNDQQRVAVKLAYEEVLALIQGPPGTGKTFVLISVILNWVRYDRGPNPLKIMVCAPSNTATENIAERLWNHPYLRDKFVRLQSQRREDILNMTEESLKPYHLMHKLLNLPAQESYE
jgi:Rad3-related DNA helicase